jgi:hypothetical protein
VLKTFWAICCLWLCGLAGSVGLADTYSLADGTTLSGDPITFSDTGIIIRLPDDKYTERMPWTKFSQAGLEQLAQNPKIKPLVEPFMQLPPVARTQPADDIKVQPVSRLTRPTHRFILGALASSSLGLMLLLAIYAANLYAAYEVASCRGRPLGVVMGLSAVLPVVGPAIFYSLPSNMQGQPTTATVATEASAAAAAAPVPGSVEATQAAQDANPSDAVIAAVAAAARAARSRAAADEPVGDDPQLEGIQISALPAVPKEEPVAQSFKRGQFTFNRRFFETKFAGFMQPVRSEADQKLEFSVKVAQATHVVQRITRLGANEVHLEVLQNQQPQEIMVPFGEIQEITIKTKTA